MISAHALRRTNPHVLALLVSFLSACEESDGPAASAADVQAIFERHGCAQMSCHDSDRLEAGVDLEPPIAWALLLEEPCANPAAAEAGMRCVVPGDLSASFLWTKLTLETVDPDLGAPMPPLGEPLSEGELDAVRSWIEAGAPVDSLDGSIDSVPRYGG